MTAQSLTYACQPLISEVLTLETLNECSKAQALSQLQQSVMQLQDRAKARGCAAQETEQASYALAALIDEQIPLRCPKLAGQWRNALLQALFCDNRGGQGFFTQLERLLEDPDQQELLSIFAICLAYGFRGKFSENGRHELAAIREQVRQTLQNNPLSLDLCATISPEQPALPANDSHKRFIWPTALALCLTMIAMASLRKRLDQTSETLLRRLPELLEPSRLS